LLGLFKVLLTKPSLRKQKKKIILKKKKIKKTTTNPLSIGFKFLKQKKKSMVFKMKIPILLFSVLLG